VAALIRRENGVSRSIRGCDGFDGRACRWPCDVFALNAIAALRDAKVLSHE
jgi:hypothetical protein